MVQHGKYKILGFWDRITKLKSAQSIAPVNVELHLTNACNLHCIWCSENDRHNFYGSVSLNRDRVFTLLHELVDLGVLSVVWEGGGEPTVSPHFVDSVLLSMELGLNNGLITNGYGLRDEKVREACIHSMNWVRISISAGTNDTYVKLHGAPYNYLQEILDGIYRLRKMSDKLDIGIRYVVTKDNASEMIQAYQMARDAGCSYIDFGNMFDGGRIIRVRDLFKDEFDRLLEYVLKRPSRTRAIVPDECNGKIDFKACRAINFVTQVSANGDVVVCCYLAQLFDYRGLDRDYYVLGNINDQSFVNIWKSERKQEIFHRFLNEDVVKRCPECRFASVNSILDGVFEDWSPFL